MLRAVACHSVPLEKQSIAGLTYERQPNPKKRKGRTSTKEHKKKITYTEGADVEIRGNTDIVILRVVLCPVGGPTKARQRGKTAHHNKNKRPQSKIGRGDRSTTSGRARGNTFHFAGNRATDQQNIAKAAAQQSVVAEHLH